MSTSQDKVGRFAWERAFRQSSLPMHLKGYLFLLGSYMDADGSKCRPSAAELEVAAGRSRQRVFEVLAELEKAGWFATVKRPGKPSLRVPRIPPGVQADPSDTSDYSDQGASDGSYGPDPSEGGHTRQTGLTDPSDTSDLPVRPVLHDHVSTNQDQPTGGTGSPPDPLPPESSQAPPRTELEQEPKRSKTPRTKVDPESRVPRAPRAKSRSWRRQRAATAHLDPEVRAAVREELEAQRRRTTFRVVEPLNEGSGAAS